MEIWLKKKAHNGAMSLVSKVKEGSNRKKNERPTLSNSFKPWVMFCGSSGKLIPPIREGRTDALKFPVLLHAHCYWCTRSTFHAILPPSAPASISCGAQCLESRYRRHVGTWHFDCLHSSHIIIIESSLRVRLWDRFWWWWCILILLSFQAVSGLWLFNNEFVQGSDLIKMGDSPRLGPQQHWSLEIWESKDMKDVFGSIKIFAVIQCSYLGERMGQPEGSTCRK